MYCNCIHTSCTLPSSTVRYYESCGFCFYRTGFRHADPIAPTFGGSDPTRDSDLRVLRYRAVTVSIRTPGLAESGLARPTGSRSGVPWLPEQAKCGHSVLWSHTRDPSFHSTVLKRKKGLGCQWGRAQQYLALSGALRLAGSSPVTTLATFS
jgi:hypothetical protein